MNEKALPVLEQYDFRIKGTRRVRGSYYCDTDKGLMLLKEYESSKGKLEIVEKLQLHIEDSGLTTDRVVRNRDGELMSQGPDGGFYILKKWYEHRESEPDNESDIIQGVVALATFHTITKDMRQVFSEEEQLPEGRNLIESLTKHNRELQKVKRYVERLKSKSDFEFQLKNEMDNYYFQAMDVLDNFNSDIYENLLKEAREKKTLCHGNSQYHNLIMVGDNAVLTNFIRINVNLQIQDLYMYLKKSMEKNNWNIKLAETVLTRYDKINPINGEEMDLLKTMFRYPEKFWKIVNNYFNSNKAWPSEKNREKLSGLREQEADRSAFLDKLQQM